MIVTESCVSTEPQNTEHQWSADWQISDVWPPHISGGGGRCVRPPEKWVLLDLTENWMRTTDCQWPIYPPVGQRHLPVYGAIEAPLAFGYFTISFGPTIHLMEFPKKKKRKRVWVSAHHFPLVRFGVGKYGKLIYHTRNNKKDLEERVIIVRGR